MKCRLVLSVVALALVAGCGGGSSKAASNTTTTPTKAPTETSTTPTTAAPAGALEPCRLVTRDDAEKVIGMPLAAGVVDGPKGDEGCTYTADPNGPVGQVEIYAGPGGKSYYDIDKGKTTADTGIGNPAVQLCARNVTHHRPLLRMGAERKHAKLWITDGRATREAVLWGVGDGPLPVGCFDLAFAPQLNDFNGTVAVQLKVLDWQPAK